MPQRPHESPVERLGGLGGRRLALLGGAIALVVLVAVIGAVLLTRGGEEAVTEPTTTTTTTTTGEGPTFPTELESRLLASVPPGIKRTCERSDPPSDAIAAVFCTPSNPGGVGYYLFANASAMAQWYSTEVDYYELQRGTGSCFSGDFVGEQSYLIAEKPAGRALCTVDDENDAVRSWTDTRLNIGTYAFRLDPKATALLRAWRDRLGPNPP